MSRKIKKANKPRDFENNPPFTKEQVAYIEWLILKHEVRDLERGIANTSFTSGVLQAIPPMFPFR